MDEADFVGLVREIEILKGKQSGHELECAQFRRNIEHRHNSFDNTLAEMKSDVKSVLSKIDSHKQVMSNKAIAWLCALILVLLGLTAWSTGQLYQLEPERLAQLSRSK